MEVCFVFYCGTNWNCISVRKDGNAPPNEGQRKHERKEEPHHVTIGASP